MNNMNRTSAELNLEEILREDPATVSAREKNAFDQLIAPFNQSIVLFGAGNLGRQVLYSYYATGESVGVSVQRHPGSERTGGCPPQRPRRRRLRLRTVRMAD
jgi:hypothetical protein